MQVKRIRGDAKRTLRLCEQAALLARHRQSCSSHENTIKVADVKAAIAMMYQGDAMKVCVGPEVEWRL